MLFSHIVTGTPQHQYLPTDSLLQWKTSSWTACFESLETGWLKERDNVSKVTTAGADCCNHCEAVLYTKTLETETETCRNNVLLRNHRWLLQERTWAMINAAGSLRPRLRPHSSHLATEIKTLIKESCSCAGGCESSDNSETLNSKDIPTNSPQRLCITAEPWDKWEHNAAFGRPYSCTREPLREPTVTCVHPVPALKKPRTGAAAHLTGGCELLKQSHRATTARVGCTL